MARTPVTAGRRAQPESAREPPPDPRCRGWSRSASCEGRQLHGQCRGNELWRAVQISSNFYARLTERLPEPAQTAFVSRKDALPQSLRRPALRTTR